MSRFTIPTEVPEFAQVSQRLSQMPTFQMAGRVNQVVGLLVESVGPNAKIGDFCQIETHEIGGGAGKFGPAVFDQIPAEIVGFKDHRALLMPLATMQGVRSGCLVRSTGDCLQIKVGPELLGRVLNGLGEPMDGKGDLKCSQTYPIENSAPNALERTMIEKPFSTGVRAIDGVLTMGIGQRVGIFAGSGVGKSTLLGMIARGCTADVNVICLVGERGREVREFIENDLQEEGLARSVVICATSDEPALVRIKAALTATAISEFFRDQGLNVMLMMDSVTRFAMAQREVGLAVGEPPSTKGYTPSVFALLPRLMERAGCGPRGAITALYTVLVDGDDTNEPISDAARSILDGHVVLSRKLTGRGHYPPIDIMQSLSRVMPMVTDSGHVSDAAKLRELMSAYLDVEDLISIGAYQTGSRPLSDEAVRKWDGLNKFLRQDRLQHTNYGQTREMLGALIHGQV